MSETNEERQDNELAALQAIYGDEVKDNRKITAWKVWRPLDLMLTLIPLHNSEIQGIHCSVTLHFKCCANYPNKPPSLAIHKMRGLSTDNATKLLAELESLAAQLCGEVMIFQLATHTQQFLHDHNKPTLSFYDEMLQHNNQKEKVKQHDLQVKENEERQKIKDEIQRRQELLREAGKQRVHRSSISQESSLDGQGDSTQQELLFYADDKMSPTRNASLNRVEVSCTCDKNKGVQVLRVKKNNKKVYIGNCLGHSVNGATTYLAIDEDTGERLITKKWEIPPANDLLTRTKQLNNLQQDIKTMSRLQHPSIVPYTAIEINKETNKKEVKQCVYIFRSFVLGSSLKYIRNRLNLIGDPFESLRLLRHVGLGLFSALKELHSEGIVHGDVRSENVYLDDWAGVKLVGASLDIRLSEIKYGGCYCDRQTRAQDILSSGQVLLSIVAQEPTYMAMPPDLPSAAKDFFAKCLTEDYSQWTAEQLVNHVFLTNGPLITVSKKENHEEDDDAKKIPHTSPATDAHSRLHAEFEVLEWLGKGAFGDVLKVKNKLDAGFYAIKRIKLNPESVQLNKNITREVKLLSWLNHENVVRYYNAWIESTMEQHVEEDSAMCTTKSPTEKGNSLEDIVAKLGQEVKVEWSMSEGPVQKSSDTDSEDSEEDDDEHDPWFNIMSPEYEESSMGIEFEQQSDNQSRTIPSGDVVDAPRPKSAKLNQVLYIQMEFCEKHTLREAIDNGLYQEHFRCWRLFREIVEGLSHVHQRGMIHRDLKPVNIFLDSNDHVKIGDFGLATKAFTGLPAVDDKAKHEEMAGSLTGHIGTALYVAPELLQSATKIIYNQKVDIYSLGIILFEMFHPLETAMERMAVLTQLRSPDVVLPEIFLTEDNAKQIHVIRWLLNHEPSLRPTCADLLSSEHVPRPVPEGALSGLLSHALSDRGSRNYQRLVTACLDQKQSAAEDYTYHNEMRARPVDKLSNIKDAVVKIFRSHGATEFAPPLLIPRARAWDQYPNAVKVMTASGSVCHLPHDLRLPFARHTAFSDIKYMRRYCVDRVYRERHVQGFHPKEMLECAFDIVTPKTDSLWSDAELLVVASRAASECSLKVSLQLNHTELLRALLVSCGVPLDKHVDIYPVLVDVSLGRIKSLQLQTHLTSLCVTRRDITNMLRLMEADVPVHELKELVTPLVKQAKCKRVAHAIHELQVVCRDAIALGCECPITVAPFLAYNATQHSGVYWQMSVINDCHKSKRKRRSGNLIAAGGRYDAFVEEFWKVAPKDKDQDNSELKTSSFGFSMSLERMATILEKMEIEWPLPSARSVESTLICICVWGTVGSGRDGQAAAQRARLARALWRVGYTACVCPARHADTHELRRPCIVLTQGDACITAVCDDMRSVREHKVSNIDVLDFIKQQLCPDTNRFVEGTSRSISWNETEKPNSPIISVTFITASDKMNKISRRSCESQINTQITSTLSTLGMQCAVSRVRVLCVAAQCEAQCVRALVAQLSAPLDHAELSKAEQLVVARFPRRQKIIEEVVTKLSEFIEQNSRCTDEILLYALYSICDSVCRLIT